MLISTQTLEVVSRFGHKKGIELLIDAGFTALDLSMFANYEYLFDDNMKSIAMEFKEYADSRGVIFNQAHAPFGGNRDEYMSICDSLLPRVIEFASYLGVNQVVVHPVKDGRYYGREKEIFDLNCKFYSSLIPLAERTGVRIAMENMFQHHPQTGIRCDDILANPYELADMYDYLDRPDLFTVCLDIGHVALCGREPEDAIRILGHERLGALHIHDNDYASDHHTLPGVGKINWEAVCSALAEIDYKGELTLEADKFLRGFDDGFIPIALRFMFERARSLADRINN